MEIASMPIEHAMSIAMLAYAKYLRFIEKISFKHNLDCARETFARRCRLSLQTGNGLLYAHRYRIHNSIVCMQLLQFRQDDVFHDAV